MDLQFFSYPSKILYCLLKLVGTRMAKNAMAKTTNSPDLETPTLMLRFRKDTELSGICLIRV